jgi:serine/threonine-protein kinase
LSVAVQHVNQEPRPLAELRSDLPPALVAVVQTMMAKRPEDRYPDAASLLQDLRLIARALKQDPQEAAETLAKFDGLVPASALPPRNVWERIARWSVRRRVIVLLALGLVIGGIAAGVGWWMRPPNPLELSPRFLSRIPDAKTPDRQYQYALFASADQEEEAWQAVIDFFSEDEDSPYVWRAREQLGILYLRSLRLNDAARIFEELTLAGEFKSRPDLRARGEAGKAIIANLEGDYARSQEIIDRHFGLQEGSEALINHLDPISDLRRFLEQAEVINRRHPGPARPSSRAAG